MDNTPEYLRYVMKDKLYQITVTGEQLHLIAQALEDWSRFLCGQTELQNSTSMLPDYLLIKDKLESLQPLVTPELPPGASYGWNGGSCPNERQRKSIAMSYGIYREIYHFLTVRDGRTMSTYASPTLRCPEQGPLIGIKELN